MVTRVIIVDDDEDARALIALTLDLEHDLAVVGAAEDGMDGVRLALRERPDVVLMDVMMPRLDGFEATRRIKHERPEIKVLIVSSFASDTMRQETRHSGADGFLSKGAIPTTLAPMIRDLARRHAPQPDCPLPETPSPGVLPAALPAH